MEGLDWGTRQRCDCGMTTLARVTQGTIHTLAFSLRVL